MVDGGRDGAAAEAATESTPGGVSTKAELVISDQLSVAGAALR